ncbi:MAG TPA: hypothetical protein PKE35_02375 [Anaerolineales bacterium]|nr:hypothetical protein [Anaerolineales bacterium]HNH77164.1 hypothetical protein [Anaerolineales bacterium]HNO83486.1 hypothetical protein [Anaerolineales bacterium]
MKKFSFRATLLQMLVLTLTAFNLLRMWTALAWQDILTEFSTQPSPIVLAVSGAVWALCGIVLLWGIWRKTAWAEKLLLGASAGYSLWYWTERLAWQNPHPNWLFAVIVNLAIIVFILFSKKSLTREAYERNIENPKID